MNLKTAFRKTKGMKRMAEGNPRAMEKYSDSAKFPICLSGDWVGPIQAAVFPCAPRSQRKGRALSFVGNRFFR